MAFEDDTKKQIESYIEGHLADWDWHQARFSIISDEMLPTLFIFKCPLCVRSCQHQN